MQAGLKEGFSRLTTNQVSLGDMHNNIIRKFFDYFATDIDVQVVHHIRNLAEQKYVMMVLYIQLTIFFFK